VDWNEPVASVVRGIGAEAIEPSRRGERAPGRPVCLQRGKRVRFRKIAELAPALLAPSIFEEQELATALALEELHRVSPPDAGAPQQARSGPASGAWLL